MSDFKQNQSKNFAIDLDYQQCTRCVMDTSAKNITFDENGVCNFCSEFLSRSSCVIHEDLKDKRLRLNSLLSIVKSSGRGKPYDCIVGVSGGADSSWALMKAVELGLRPLAVHMDNGWNSELAQNNIANLVKELCVDLYTHVIDWAEYRALMQAFFDADVIDVNYFTTMQCNLSATIKHKNLASNIFLQEPTSQQRVCQCQLDGTGISEIYAT